MSSEALAWAFRQECKASSVKFTLVALCECANFKTGRITPSVAHIAEITGQNRKTIIANIAELERAGLISDTGERAGRTGQIKVYAAAIETVPKEEPISKLNSTVFGRKESQKRDTEPSLEPSDLPSGKSKRAGNADLPAWLPEDAWRAYLDMRKRKRAVPTERATALLLADLSKWRAKGHDPGTILDNSTKNNWTGLFEPKGGANDKPAASNDEIQNPYARVVARRAAERAAAQRGKSDCWPEDGGGIAGIC